MSLGSLTITYTGDPVGVDAAKITSEMRVPHLGDANRLGDGNPGRVAGELFMCAVDCGALVVPAGLEIECYVDDEGFGIGGFTLVAYAAWRLTPDFVECLAAFQHAAHRLLSAWDDVDADVLGDSYPPQWASFGEEIFKIDAMRATPRVRHGVTGGWRDADNIAARSDEDPNDPRLVERALLFFAAELNAALGLRRMAADVSTQP